MEWVSLREKKKSAQFFKREQMKDFNEKNYINAIKRFKSKVLERI